MKAAVYARVSTADKDQDPETQLHAVRRFCADKGWEITGEYVDKASAADLRGRVRWRELIDRRLRGVDVLVVFRLDRAFRSVAHLHKTLEDLEAQEVQFVSVNEPQMDTTTAMGRFVMTLLAAVAELELSTIRERVNAGMARARAEGQTIGRPNRSQYIDWEYVQKARQNGSRAWLGIARGHPPVQTSKGPWRPSARTLQRAWEARAKGGSESSMVTA